MDFDAVFYGESEYIIDVLIWPANSGLALILRGTCNFFCNKTSNVLVVFDPYLYENRVELQQIYYQNDQHDKLYKL
jgi:hypothetical protein